MVSGEYSLMERGTLGSSAARGRYATASTRRPSAA